MFGLDGSTASLDHVFEAPGFRSAPWDSLCAAPFRMWSRPTGNALVVDHGLSSRMGRAGIEPATLGLKVDASLSRGLETADPSAYLSRFHSRRLGWSRGALLTL